MNINNNNIPVYHMDMYQSIMLEHRYFTSADYLAVQGFITAMLLYPTNILLAGQNFHHFFKYSFLGMVRYFHFGPTLVSYNEIVVVLDDLTISLSPHFQFNRSKLYPS